MSKFALAAETALGDAKFDCYGTTITEITDRGIMSIAIPLGGEEKLSKAIASSFKTEIPAVGKSTTSKLASSRFLGLQPNLLFVLFTEVNGSMKKVALALKATAYLTDQSDSWVTLSMRGDKCRAALERICPIDLHPVAFPEGAIARTTMDHLATIVVREGPDSFLLLSPRSSAKSFWHALETSVRNIL